ncbi:MAG: hypothetical protein ACMV0H_01280 [Aquaspirillum sp.]
MTEKDKKTKLRELYADNLVARKIFDLWALRKNAMSESLLERTNIDAKIGDYEAVKNFFRTLEEYGFGRYIKRSRGGNARFEWGVIDEDDSDSLWYSLVAVAKIAKGGDEAWDGIGSVDEFVEDGYSSKIETGLSDGAVPIKLATNNMAVYLELPKNFDPDEDFEDLEDLLELIKASVKSKFKRRRA